MGLNSLTREDLHRTDLQHADSPNIHPPHSVDFRMIICWIRAKMFFGYNAVLISLPKVTVHIPSVSPSSEEIRIVPFPSSICTSGATIANFSFTIWKDKNKFKTFYCKMNNVRKFLTEWFNFQFKPTKIPLYRYSAK